MLWGGGIIYLFLNYPWWYGWCLLSVEGDQTLVFLPELCAVLTHDVDWSRHQHQLRTDNTNSPTVQWGLSTTSLVRQYSALLWCCGAVVLWCCSAVVQWCTVSLPSHLSTTSHSHHYQGPPTSSPTSSHKFFHSTSVWIKLFSLSNKKIPLSNYIPRKNWYLQAVLSTPVGMTTNMSAAWN